MRLIDQVKIIDLPKHEDPFKDTLYTPEEKDLNTLREHFQDELQCSPNKHKKIRSKTII